MSHHKPRLPRRISHSTPPSTKGYHSRYPDSDDDYSSRDDYPRRRGSADDVDPRYSRGRGSGRARGRERSADRHYSDNGNDTDYDPLDKYYLSGDEKRDERRQRQQQKPQRGRGRGRSLSNLRGKSRGRRSPSRSSSTSSSSSRSSSASSDTNNRSRGRKSHHHPLRSRLSRTFSRRRHNHSPTPSSRSSSPSRSRSPSSSRYSSRSKSKSKPRNPFSRSKSPSPPPTPRTPVDMIAAAVRTAFEAGAVAALKLRDDPSPLLGAKGSKIATAALAAAVVDTFIDKKYPKRKGGLRHTVMRQATQMAIGNLVMPAVQGKKVGGKAGGKAGMLKGPLMGGTTRRRRR